MRRLFGFIKGGLVRLSNFPKGLQDTMSDVANPRGFMEKKEKRGEFNAPFEDVNSAGTGFLMDYLASNLISSAF